MTAANKKYGAPRKVFIVVPSVSAFFIDLVNAVYAKTFLSRRQSSRGMSVDALAIDAGCRCVFRLPQTEAHRHYTRHVNFREGWRGAAIAASGLPMSDCR